MLLVESKGRNVEVYGVATCCQNQDNYAQRKGLADVWIYIELFIELTGYLTSTLAYIFQYNEFLGCYLSDILPK